MPKYRLSALVSAPKPSRVLAVEISIVLDPQDFSPYFHPLEMLRPVNLSSSVRILYLLNVRTNSYFKH
jgi:hypothetical protein